MNGLAGRGPRKASVEIGFELFGGSKPGDHVLPDAGGEAGSRELIMIIPSLSSSLARPVGARRSHERSAESLDAVDNGSAGG